MGFYPTGTRDRPAGEVGRAAMSAATDSPIEVERRNDMSTTVARNGRCGI